MLKYVLAFLFLAIAPSILSSASFAQEFDPLGKTATDIHPTDVIQWTPVQALSDGKGHLLVGLRLETKDQFTIYKNKLEVRGPNGYSIAIKSAPESRKQMDPMGEGETDVYFGGDFELELIGDKPINSGMVSIFVTFLGGR
ncbi:MAG: hypothetical protein EOP07_05200 [Proteobacteria bacterium]|nr:MAG: hypothetical protein EOP07_05200 [Pseudomonadota bacterium]